MVLENRVRFTRLFAYTYRNASESRQNQTMKKLLTIVAIVLAAITGTVVATHFMVASARVASQPDS